MLDGSTQEAIVTQKYVVSGMCGHTTTETLAQKYSIRRGSRTVAWAVDAPTARKIVAALNAEATPPKAKA